MIMAARHLAMAGPSSSGPRACDGPQPTAGVAQFERQGLGSGKAPVCRRIWSDFAAPGLRHALVEPVQRGLGDLAPAVIDGQRVAPVGELAQVVTRGLVVEPGGSRG